MTMLDIIKEDVGRMKCIAAMNGDFDVVAAIEETMVKIEYYEKGVDEALCAMEKSWKARDAPHIEIKSLD